MAKLKPFKKITPADIIKDELDAYLWNEDDLVEILEMSREGIMQLLNNEILIDIDLATKLSRIFRQSTQFWLNVSKEYWKKHKK